MHYYGTGVLKDYKEALKWYSKAAEQGTTLAQFSLGNMYVKGEGVLKDYKKAAKWYKKAAEQGDIYAQYRLYIHANEMNIDTKKSLDWLHMSAGKDIFEFFELESDKKIIIKSYKEAVCRGYAESQYLLGTIYFENRKSAKDMSKSKYWINKAYENSDKDVAKKAADFWNKNELWINQDYKFKNTTEPSCEEKIGDIVKNVLTFEEKTERELRGFNDLDIGYRLREGSIILRDPIKAIKHFKKASKKGADKIKAAYELGVIYFEENSVQNYSESKKWIKKAYESTEIEISKKAEDYWNKHELWNY
jgi:TPR repeat protein